MLLENKENPLCAEIIERLIFKNKIDEEKLSAPHKALFEEKRQEMEKAFKGAAVFFHEANFSEEIRLKIALQSIISQFPSLHYFGTEEIEARLCVERG